MLFGRAGIAVNIDVFGDIPDIVPKSMTFAEQGGRLGYRLSSAWFSIRS